MDKGYISLGRDPGSSNPAESPPRERRRRRPTVKQLDRLVWLARYGWLYCGERVFSDEEQSATEGDQEAVEAFKAWVEGQKELTQERRKKLKSEK